MSSERVAIHFTGRPSFERGGRSGEVLDVRRRLRSESATDPRADDTQLVGIEAQHRAVGGVERVGRLVRDPAGEPAVGRDGQDAVGLHRDARQALAHHRQLGDDVGPFERVGVVAFGERGAEAHVRAVLGEEERCVARHRIGSGQDRCQRVVVDDHLLGRVARLGSSLGDDRGHDVADEPHLLRREHRTVQRLRHHHELLEGREGEVVVARVDGHHARHRRRAAGVDRQEVGVGDRGTHERDVEHVGLDEVVDVLPRSCQQRRVFEATNGVSEDRT